MRLIVALFAFAILMPAPGARAADADGGSVAQKTEDTAKQGAQAVGQGVTKAAKTVGHTARKVVKKVGSGARQAGHAVGKAANDAVGSKASTGAGK